MKVVFYLPNQGNKGVDFSNPYGVNPGVGGTQYMIWLISCMLSADYKDTDVILAADIIEKMPDWMNCVEVHGTVNALKKAEELSADIFVCRGPYLDDEFIRCIKSTSLKVIIWNHNYENDRIARITADCDSVKRCVCVSREQYERLCDHKVFGKSTYIYNALPIDRYTVHKRSSYNRKAICYVGSLHKEKGFLQLAKKWHTLEKKDSDIQLYVIGSGALYNTKNKLGKYGLAQDKYERKFIKYLIDKHGNIKDNVHFMGVVGFEDKLKIMNKSAVGILNPLGKDETFCIGAVEFEALGVPVTARKKYAFLDTAADGEAGLLYKNYRGMVNNIIRLINDSNLNKSLGESAALFAARFDIPAVTKEWHSLLDDVYSGKEQLSCRNLHNIRYNKKILRIINMKIRNIFPFMPSILWYEDIPQKVKSLIRKIVK